jgi:hypothetical protein
MMSCNSERKLLLNIDNVVMILLPLCYFLFIWELIPFIVNFVNYVFFFLMQCVYEKLQLFDCKVRYLLIFI